MYKKLLAILVFILGVMAGVVYITGDLSLFSFFGLKTDKSFINKTSNQLDKNVDEKDILGFLKSVPDHSVVEWQIGEELLMVEVVNTPESITKGLGGRKNLEDSDEIVGLDSEKRIDGMLFVFPESVKTSFWMKDMLFAIDLFWIKEGEIIEVERNMLPPVDLQRQENLSIYESPGLVEMVLEIPVGENLQLF
ncbi:MAG: DUF192 domain-containing protein [Candidatus Pacebacteria bacterium]|jgi:uncharacterized membrane protein (UPF0127 family)|nr:DUF192 domain-containing protein [Candidatus Paceibacterota bacterium]MBT4652575.1 DUF192 domain-containing protein [Candidatus Paceibacterota bacterium]MBT6756402.1 DUF192 domain-containing protein [Candidatus Paceibacterota bacterium]MBT6921304.1 DUF192 domain-containing protein [Candidatus Paceibacterota bacterium]